MTTPSQPHPLVGILSFYRKFGRPLTAVELMRALYPAPPGDIANALIELEKEGSVVSEDGFYTLPNPSGNISSTRRTQDLLLDHKWRRLMKLAGWFNWIPFVDFVYASGSLALGNVTPESDFDLLIGVRPGRMFTARYAVVALFSLLGVRRMDDMKDSSPDKLCFNHFITPVTYSKEPHNEYRKELYRNLVPLWGRDEALSEFIRANVWSGAPDESHTDLRRTHYRPTLVRTILEWIAGSRFGNFIERKFLAPTALHRLRSYAGEKHHAGRVVINEQELEFHFDLPFEA